MKNKKIIIELLIAFSGSMVVAFGLFLVIECIYNIF